MPHLLEVEGLTTVFDSDYGRTVSVDHVNFHVDKGEVVCIVGESGLWQERDLTFYYGAAWKRRNRDGGKRRIRGQEPSDDDGKRAG